MDQLSRHSHSPARTCAAAVPHIVLSHSSHSWRRARESARASSTAARDGPPFPFHEYGKIPGALGRGHYTSALLKMCIPEQGCSWSARRYTIIGPAPSLQILQSERATYLCLRTQWVAYGWLGLLPVPTMFAHRWIIPHQQMIRTISSALKSVVVLTLKGTYFFLRGQPHITGTAKLSHTYA